jgi:hypothetical protein
LDAAELEECMKDLDINHDNKISYDEFKKWWLSGRQGLSPLMRRLLATKLKTLKLIGQISGPLKDVLAEADSGQAVEMTTNSLSINLNKVTGAAGTLIYVKVLLLSPELREEHNRIKTLHKFGIPEEDSPIVGSVNFEIKDNKIDEVMAKVEKYIAEHAGPLKDLISVVAEGHRLCVGISLPKFQGK